MITEQFIQELITCDKVIENIDRQKIQLINRSYRNKFTLSSVDQKYRFLMFVRYSDEFMEDFSVGLQWINPNEFIGINKNILLFRCQGPHDSRDYEEIDCHHSYHTHTITVKDINARRYMRPSMVRMTDEYVSYEKALDFFVQRCNIIDFRERIKTQTYISGYDNQISMFD